MNDTQRLDLLDGLSGSYTGRIVLRMSTMGRGWRLHETSRKPNFASAREAIDSFLDANHAGENWL